MLKKLFPYMPTFSYHFWLYFVTFFVILPFIGKDLVFSVYRSSTWTTEVLQKKILQENDAAVKIADEYLAAMKPANDHVLLEKKEMIIAIVTVRRFSGSKPLGYLTRVTTTFHQLFERDSSVQSKHLFICNTQAGPGRHEEADRLKQYFLSVQRFPNGSAEASIMNPFEKEKQDYIFCLEQALNFGPEFVLMVEDDALPRDELFPVLVNMISYLNDEDHVRGHVRGQRLLWSHLKLYFPERWQGYSFEWQKIVELFALFFMGATTFSWCNYSLCRNRQLLASRKANGKTSLLGGVYFVLLALAIGRQHLLGLKRIWPFWYSLVTAPECCSPCILYARESALDIVHHLKTVKCSQLMPLDIALNKFTQTQSLPGYLVEPNIFHHIGFVSTIKGLSTHPEEFVV